MEKVVGFEDIKGLYEKLVKKLNLEKDHPEKFMVSLVYAYPENVETLETAGIVLNKPSYWSVLAIEPEVLKKTVLRARDLGFIKAYQQNPSFIKTDVDTLVKRMSECDAHGINYLKDDKYQKWIFGNRSYNYVIGMTKKSEPKEDAPRRSSVDPIEAKEYAKRVMETFALEGDEEKINTKLEELLKTDLDIKSILMELFKEYAVDNLDYLSITIDEILNYDKEEKRGRVAA